MARRYRCSKKLEFHSLDLEFLVKQRGLEHDDWVHRRELDAAIEAIPHLEAAN